MKKSLIVLLVLIINLLLVIYVSAEIRINEIESNPSGSDSGNEWIELYSENEANLNNWRLVNKDEQEIELNKSFSGYLVIDLIRQWLDNSDEKIFLYNNGELIDETNVFDDPYNNDKTWQYCGDWKFVESTKNSENNCTTVQDNPPQDNQNEQTGEEEIHLEIEFDEEDIINGEEFKIKIKAENLKEKDYNFKIWIEDEDEEKTINDRYGKDSGGESIWKSGEYLIYDFFEGPGDEEKNVKLRIREDYSDFSGDAEICFKIQGVSESEDCEYTEILKKQEENKENQTSMNNMGEGTLKELEEKQTISGEVIKLGNFEFKKTTNNQEDEINNIVYESKNEKMKKYAIFGFAGLCLSLVILLLFNKLN